MRMHLAVEEYPPPQYEGDTHENERLGNMFHVHERDEQEYEAYDDEPFMEELAGLDMFDSRHVRQHQSSTARPIWCICGSAGVPTSHGTVLNTLHLATDTMMRRRPCTPITFFRYHQEHVRRRRSLTVLC